MAEKAGAGMGVAASGVELGGVCVAHQPAPASGGGTWTTIAPIGDNVNNVFVHSIMGGIAVGNYDVGGEPNGYAFLYDIKTQISTTYRVPDSYSTTLYGIWHNGGSSYTLVGGCTMA